jgi:hypothetical protein
MHGADLYVSSLHTFYGIRVLTKPETIPNLAEVLVNTESSPHVSNYFKNF